MGFSIPRLRRSEHVSRCYLGRWPRLLHFAPLSPPSRSGYCLVRATHDSFLHLILRGAIPTRDAGLIGGFFDSMRNGFADALIED